MTKKEKGLLTHIANEFFARSKRKPTAGYSPEMQEREKGNAEAYLFAAEWIESLRDGHTNCPSVEQLLALAPKRLPS